MDRNLFDIPHHANLFALIYRSAYEQYGEKGGLAVDEGTKLYGMQRGMRMAKRAVRDRQPLTMENYLAYGEWEDKSGLSKSEITQTSPVYYMECQICGWCEAWKDAGLLEYGRHYCDYVDKSLVRGFNPGLKLDIESVISKGDRCCGFKWNGFKLETEEQKKAFAEKKQKLGNRPVKDFLYHTGHLLSAMKTALRKVLGEESMEKIIDKAMKDYAEMYSKEMADAVIEESKQNFLSIGDY